MAKRAKTNLKTLDDAASAAGIGRRTLQRWLFEGLLTAYRIHGDRRRYIDLDEVNRLREPQPVQTKGGGKRR